MQCYICFSKREDGEKSSGCRPVFWSKPGWFVWPGSSSSRWVQRGERAPAVAPAAPVRHGTVLAEGKPSRSGRKSSVMKSRVPSVQPRGCSSGAAPVIGERIGGREKGENEGLIQNTPQHLEKWWGSAGPHPRGFTRKAAQKWKLSHLAANLRSPPPSSHLRPLQKPPN